MFDRNFKEGYDETETADIFSIREFYGKVQVYIE